MLKVIYLSCLIFSILSCQPTKPDTGFSKEKLNLPQRPKDAISGSAFARKVVHLELADRENAIVQEILSGNVPSFCRNFKPVEVIEVIDGKSYKCHFFAIQDYLAIGSDKDYLYIPMTPATAQYLAGHTKCVLPTAKMVDLIYNNADIQLAPQPIPPTDTMTTIPVFKHHTDSIVLQMEQKSIKRTGDQLMAGHKKDIVLSNKIYQTTKAKGSVVIYGWHLGVGEPIQPVYNGHHEQYADYSHGVRLISEMALVNGAALRIDSLLKHPDLSKLLSKEGVILRPHYPEVIAQE